MKGKDSPKRMSADCACFSPFPEKQIRSITPSTKHQICSEMKGDQSTNVYQTQKAGDYRQENRLGAPEIV